MLLLAVTLTACALCCLVLAVRTLARTRAAQTDSAAHQPAGLRALGALLRPQGDRSLADLKGRTSHAGLYGQDALDLYLSVRLIVLTLGVGSGLLAVLTLNDGIVGGALLLMLGSLGLFGPGIWLDARARQRQTKISDELPQVLSLVTVSLEAGLSPNQAIERVTLTGRGRKSLLLDELQLVLGDLKLGLPLDKALARFATRTGNDDVKALAGVIGRGAQLGAKIREVLDQHIEQMLHARLMTLEENTGKSTAKLTLPLTLCLLPAAIFILIGPSFLALLANL